MTGGRPATKKLAVGPMGRVPGQDDTPRVPVFPPLAGWPWTGHSGLLSFWQMRRLDRTVLTRENSVMFLAQPSLGFCGRPVTILSWDEALKAGELRAMTARPQTSTSTSE